MLSVELYVPFRLQPQYTFSSNSGTVPVPAGGAPVTLEAKGSHFNLRVDGLRDETEGDLWIPRAFTGLTSLMLEMKSAFTASWNLVPAQAVNATGSPHRTNWPQFDVVGDDSAPFLVESGKQVGVFVAFPPSVSVSSPIERAAEAIGKGMQGNAEDLFKDQRFRTAVELFASAAFEESPNTRLLSNAMALEVLAPPTEKHPVALELAARWEGEINSLLAEWAAESEEHHALASLRRELVVRRTASIRSRIRSLVLNSLRNRSDAAALAREAVECYDKRSTLVHTGSLAGNTASAAAAGLRRIMELILASRLFGP